MKTCRLWLLSVLAIGVSGVGSAAYAQPILGCRTDVVPSGPFATYPASGAGGVTLDAPLRVSYSKGYLDGANVDALIEVFACLDNGCTERTAVEGQASAVADELFFVPAFSWNPFTQYRGTAHGTDRNLQFGFTTGSAVDSSPPTFSGGISVNTEPAQDPCHKESDPGGPPIGYRVEVSFAPATDDGAPGDIEYQLFLTRGLDVGGAELVAQARNFAATERVSLAFFLDEDTAKQTHCVDMIVIDGVGNVTDAQSPECFNATLGRDFVSCALQSHIPPANSLWSIAIAAALLNLRRKRSAANSR